MPVKILMPALSPTMKSGTLAKWLVNEGEKIEAGQLIAEIETDKATMEFETADEGILGKILIPEKTSNINVNEPIAILLQDGESNKELEEMLSEMSKPITLTEEDNKAGNFEANEESGSSPTIETKNSKRILATPLARKIASTNNIDLSLIKTASGPGGRIVKKDMEEFLGNAKSGCEKSHINWEVPISPMRRVIADRLLESKQNVPHFYLSMECFMEQLLLARKNLNEVLETKVTVNDFIIKASAFALQRNPSVNASWEESFIKQKQSIDISVAVAIPDGLITPIIFSADELSLPSISIAVKELVNKAKSGTLQPREFEGGSFTISNLGMYGIDSFTAIINPPQAAILAVGAIRKAPKVIENTIVIQDVVTLTLSCDHRIVDGALAAQFMQSLKKAIENPVVML